MQDDMVKAQGLSLEAQEQVQEPISAGADYSGQGVRETVFYLEAANGMMVRVPASKLESWQKAQEEVRNGTFKTNEEMLDEYMLSVYGETGR